MRYTLRQLEVFLATAHFENVSRAADHLSMSQSAASGALKELESQFEIKLFERAGKRLRLNESWAASCGPGPRPCWARPVIWRPGCWLIRSWGNLMWGRP